MSHVLVVDDEPTVRLYFPKTLTAAGFTCQTATSRQQALAAAEAQWPDVVLLDLSLVEDHDGWEIWDELARRAAYRPLRVIVLSGVLSAQDRIEARRRGAAAALVKTVPPQFLIKAVSTALCAPSAGMRAGG